MTSKPTIEFKSITEAQYKINENLFARICFVEDANEKRALLHVESLFHFWNKSLKVFIDESCDVEKIKQQVENYLQDIEINSVNISIAIKFLGAEGTSFNSDSVETSVENALNQVERLVVQAQKNDALRPKLAQYDRSVTEQYEREHINSPEV